MQPTIEYPPGDPPAGMSTEKIESVVAMWRRMPAPVREEIVSLWEAGWRLKEHYGSVCLTHPDDDDVWVHIDPITFAKALSVKRAWQLDEEAGRGWWSYDR